MTKLTVFAIISILFIVRKAYVIYDEELEQFIYTIPAILLGIIPNIIIVGIAYILLF